MSTHEMVARHVAAALAEAAARSIADDVVARCLLSEAIRIFKHGRSNDDIAAELAAAADNLDEDSPLIFIRP
jgi:O-methyltransferase involved in polyketide biosynthesis